MKGHYLLMLRLEINLRTVDEIQIQRQRSEVYQHVTGDSCLAVGLSASPGGGLCFPDDFTYSLVFKHVIRLNTSCCLQTLTHFRL